MKNAPVLLAVVLVLMGTGSHAFAAPAKAEVIFSHPEKFTDVKSGDFSNAEKDRDYLLQQIKGHLEEATARLLPADQKLTITITNIDMAGDFESWRGPGYEKVRVYRSIYPARIDLEFKLTGADGQVLASGNRRLRSDHDTDGYEASFYTEYTNFEKYMLSEWLKDEFVRHRADKS
jgi:hypothetical protein